MLYYTDHHGFPFFTFIDTPRAFTDLKSKELGQEIMRNDISYPVKFYGKVVTDSDARDDGLGSSRSLWMMHGIFRSNGRRGYLKKLGFLMRTGSNVDMLDPKATHMCRKHCRGESHNEKEYAVGFMEAWKIPGVAPFAVEKDDVDKSKEKEDAIEKMNETEHVSEETQENGENKKSETKATEENDGKYNEKSESEDNHNEDDHVKEVDNVNQNENENKSDGNDQSVREENWKGYDASSEVIDDSQKTSKPIQRSIWCLKM
nr:acetyl-coenzyme A carboxylase carboxyl transferase subunit alpha, chloroplastic-like [Tanacetum cinerariifolium]